MQCNVLASVRPSVMSLFSNLDKNSMQRGRQTFPSEYDKDGHTITLRDRCNRLAEAQLTGSIAIGPSGRNRCHAVQFSPSCISHPRYADTKHSAFV